MPRLVFLANELDFLISHRLVLVRGAQAAGHEVMVVGPESPAALKLAEWGIPFFSWSIDRKGQSLAREAGALARLVSLYRRLKPELVHHVTIKPVLYGTLAAQAAGVPGVVNAVSGLGYVFLRTGITAAMRRAAVVAAYRFATSKRNSVVILQNDDDERDLRRLGALGSAPIVKIRGSGVDLDRFFPTEEPQGVPVVVLPARLLRDKGVGEFVDAARHLKAENVAARMVLVGGVDVGNPAAISKAELDRWVSEGLVEWWGHRSDMPEVFRQANVVCLPSYREGMPKALLEAAAAGRALVTTDTPGCRDVVERGRLGTLVPVRDARGLACAIKVLCQDPVARGRQAAALALHAHAKFGEKVVLAQHLDLYARLLRRT